MESQTATTALFSPSSLALAATSAAAVALVLWSRYELVPRKRTMRAGRSRGDCVRLGDAEGHAPLPPLSPLQAPSRGESRVQRDCCVECPSIAPSIGDGGAEDSDVIIIGKEHDDPFSAHKRKNYLSWDEYFMSVAFLSAMRSKDPRRQVGAVIVSPDRVILGIGYNGFPRGGDDDALPWAKKSINNDVLETKHPYVCHAEMNAILNKNTASVAGGVLYCTLFPCSECAKLIIQSGIREVVFYAGKDDMENKSVGGMSSWTYAASKTLLGLGRVKVMPAQQLKARPFRFPAARTRSTQYSAWPGTSPLVLTNHRILPRTRHSTCNVDTDAPVRIP